VTEKALHSHQKKCQVYLQEERKRVREDYDIMKTHASGRNFKRRRIDNFQEEASARSSGSDAPVPATVRM
jgi:hypothetical protein